MTRDLINSNGPVIRLEKGHLSAFDLTAEDVRATLNLPKLTEKEVVFGSSGDWTRSKKHKALVNAQTGQLYGIHSDTYRTVRHEEGLLEIMRTVEGGPETGPVEWSLQQVGDGKRARMVGILVDRPEEIQVGDYVNPTIEYLNSYDGSWGERFLMGAFRVACRNGMVVGIKLDRMTAVHLGEERPQSIMENLGRFFDQFSFQTTVWRAWVEKPLSIAHVEDSFEVLDLNKSERASILDEPAIEEINLWGFYNILTAIVTHQMTKLDRQVKTWNRLRVLQNRWNPK